MNKETDSLPAVVILAGGLGTRLRAAYAKGPKSMAPIGGRPFIDFLLRWLQFEGVKKVILCIGYRRAQIQKYVGKGTKWGLQVTYSIEKKLLGTGGAVKKAEGLIPGDILIVINGDTFLDVNLRELVQFHRSRGAFASIAAVNLTDSRRYGSLKMSGDGRITAFLEKTSTESPTINPRHRRPINGGVYVFEKKLLSQMRPRVPISLENKVFPRLAARKSIHAFVNDAYFVDIGVPDDLRRAQNELPKWFGTSDSR